MKRKPTFGELIETARKEALIAEIRALRVAMEADAAAGRSQTAELSVSVLRMARAAESLESTVYQLMRAGEGIASNVAGVSRAVYSAADRFTPPLPWYRRLWYRLVTWPARRRFENSPFGEKRMRQIREHVNKLPRPSVWGQVNDE